MKRLLVPLLAASSLLAMSTGFADAQTQAAAQPVDQNNLSYAIGVMTGRAFKSRQMDINANQYTAGFKAGITGGTTRLTDEQMKSVLNTYQKQAAQKRKQDMQEKADANSKAGDSFQSDNKAKDGVQTTASGLQYKIIEPGKGQSPTESDRVTVDYEGKLTDGTVFDSSYKRGKPVTFPVNGVIKGWQEALQMMKPGATWEVVIPGDLAYGKMGMPGTPIGPNATLIFKIHLISVEK